jgi:geranylgeranyl pyrophosphate synthase
MYHTASLTHDDVIDGADLRRGRPSLNRRWGQKKSVYAGCFTMAVANMKVAQLRNDEVVFFFTWSQSILRSRATTPAL